MALLQLTGQAPAWSAHQFGSEALSVPESVPCMLVFSFAAAEFESLEEHAETQAHKAKLNINTIFIRFPPSVSFNHAGPCKPLKTFLPYIDSLAHPKLKNRINL
jgi:hypothetical protein